MYVYARMHVRLHAFDYVRSMFARSMVASVSRMCVRASRTNICIKWGIYLLHLLLLLYFDSVSVCCVGHDGGGNARASGAPAEVMKLRSPFSCCSVGVVVGMGFLELCFPS